MKKVLLTKKILLLCLLSLMALTSWAEDYYPSNNYSRGNLIKNSSGEDVRYLSSYSNRIAITGSFYNDSEWRWRNNNGSNEWMPWSNQTLSIMNLFNGDKVKISFWGSSKPTIKSNNTNKGLNSVSSEEEVTLTAAAGSIDFTVSLGIYITKIVVTPANTQSRIAFDTSKMTGNYYRSQLSSRSFNEPALSVYPSNATVTYEVTSYDDYNGNEISKDPNYDANSDDLNKHIDKQVATLNVNENDAEDQDHSYRKIGDLLFKNIGFCKVKATANGQSAEYWVEVWDNEACYEFVNNNTRFQFIPNPDEALTEASQRGGFMANRVVSGVGGIEMTIGNPYNNSVIVYNNNGHMVCFSNASNGWWDRFPYRVWWPTEGTFYQFEATAKGKLKFGGVKQHTGGRVYLVNKSTLAQTDVFAADQLGYLESGEIEMDPGQIYYMHGEAESGKWGNFTLEWFSFETDLKVSAKYGVAAECGATSVTSLETVTGAGQATIVGYKGTIESAKVSLSNNHIVFSDITYKTNEDNKKGGAIKVRLSQGSSYVDYVMTIPYGTHVWDFRKSSDEGGEFTNAQLVADMNNNSNDLYRVYKIHRRADGKWIELESPILAAHSAVEGNNAFFMSYTNGLVFLTSADHFGAGETVNEHGSTYEKNHGLAGIDDDEEYYYPASTVKEAELVWIQGTTTILFPGVKAGQYIKIWNRRHADNKGETWTARNLVDLNGVAYDESIEFKLRGISDDRVTYKDDMLGGALFRVPDDYTATNDLTKLPAISLTDDGWSKIYKIEIMDECKPDLFLTEEPGWNDWYDFLIIDDDSENASVVVVDGVPVKKAYDGHAGRIGATQAHTCRFDVEYDPNQVDIEVNKTVSPYGAAYNRLEITYNGGYGLVKIIQSELGDNEGDYKYVYSKNETYIAVGELTTQQYPYTWDFTDYNMFLGTKTNKTAEKMAAAKTAGAYGIWTGTEKPFSQPAYVDEDFLPQVNVEEQPNTLTRKPLFAQGSQLSALNNAIAETEGLGIYRPFQANQKSFYYYFTIEGTFAKRERKYNAYDLQNDALKATGDDVEGVGKINVPKVDAGMYVFVKASKEPTSVSANAAKVTKYEGHVNNFDLVNGVYVYKVNTKGDVTLDFGTEAYVYKIGVTDQFKQIVNNAGKTTESRAIDIDYMQTNAFADIDMHAYRAFDYVDNNDKTSGSMSIEEVGPTAKEQGLLLFCEGGGNVSCPLFVPAVNNEAQTYSASDNKLIANVTAGTAPASTEDTYNYVFTNVYYNSKGEKQTSDSYSFYKVKSSGTLRANMAYLQLSKSNDKVSYTNEYVVIGDNGNATAIEAIEMANGVSDINGTEPVFYNLQGVRMNGIPSQKGIYIVNGKKVYVK